MRPMTSNLRQVNIVNIQSFCIHDGEGIRTTVFFKGCPLACVWCHNPETQQYNRQLMVYGERCVACGQCVPRCPQGCIRSRDTGIDTDFAACTACGACEEVCGYGVREIAGRQYSVEELASLLTRDCNFFDNSGGGVTLSGGEPLAQQPGFILSLLKRLKRRGINIAVDTCGDVPWEYIGAALPYTDTFLYDLKAADPGLHRAYTGRGNDRILANLTRLSREGGRIRLRVPVIGGCNDSDEEMTRMIAVATDLQLIGVNLLPYHKTGRDKWARLGVKATDDSLTAPGDKRMAELKKLWINAGFPSVEIGG